jgi:hypothetical protein
LKDGGCLQHIGDSKIGTIKSKPNVKYPMIRLPQEYVQIIGQRAHIYKTDHDGQPAFLVVPYAEASAQSAASKSRVSKPSLETEAESRLSALESQIAELKSLLLTNQNQKALQSPLFRQSTQKERWARPDSNRRPPPCEGDVITA